MGGFEHGLIHYGVAAGMGEREVADGAVALDGNLQPGREVVAMFRRNGGGLLPLTVEAIVDQCVIGIDGRWIGAVASRSTSASAATFGSKESVLRIGVPLAFSPAGGCFFGIAGALLGIRSGFLTIGRLMRSRLSVSLMGFRVLLRAGLG